MRRWTLPLIVVALMMAAGAVGAPSRAAGGSVSGTVTAADSGDPLEYVLVCAITEPPSDEPPCAWTSPTGSYTLTAPPGTYRIQFWDSYNRLYQRATTDPVVVGDDPIGGMDQSLTLRPVVSGAVTDTTTTNPVADFEVCAIRAGGTDEECTTTDNSGQYRLPLEPGDYRLRFSREIGDWQTSTRSITVGAADQPGIDAQTAPALLLSGDVSVPASEDYSADNVEICLLEPATGAEIDCLRAESNGDWQVAVSPGSYLLSFRPDSDAGWAAQFHPGALNADRGVPVQVTTADVGGLNATISKRGRVLGTVTGPGEAALDEFRVCAVPISDPDPAAGVCTDVQGSDTYELLPPVGSYYIWASGSAGDTTYTEWFDNVRSPQDATPFAFDRPFAGHTVDLTLDLGPAVPTTPTPTPSVTTAAPVPTATTPPINPPSSTPPTTAVPRPTSTATVVATRTSVTGWPRSLKAKRGKATVSVTARPGGRAATLQRQVCKPAKKRTTCSWQRVRQVTIPARGTTRVSVTTTKGKRSLYRLVLPATAKATAVTTGTLAVTYRK